ncbi:hypothetical protein OC845_004244 [Tilletia horrida]|nr:hypothetical protein OC845_004244 [Tilletia horrida]
MDAVRAGSSSTATAAHQHASPRKIACSSSSSRTIAPVKRRRRRPRTTAVAVALTLTALFTVSNLATPALASQGDRSPEFQACLNSCTIDNCGKDKIDDGVVLTRRLPLILRATFWTCPDNCKYHCTHSVTNEAQTRVKRIKHDAWERARYLAPGSGEKQVERNSAERRAEANRLVRLELAQLRPVQKEMVQFYGKWVFVRILGLQEPFSVLFSILNLREHLNAFYKLRREVPDAYPLKLLYIVHSLISVNAWFWSAVFHSRDKPLTERFDYFSAASALLSGLFFSICRLFRLEPDAPQFTTLLRVFAAVFTLHCLYLSLSSRFDYGYNVLACLFIAAVHELLWLAFSLRPTIFPSNQLLERYHSNRAAYRAAKPQTSNIASSSNSAGTLTPTSVSPLPAPAASPAAVYKGHSPPASMSMSSSSAQSALSQGGGPPSSSLEARRQLRKILIFILLAMSFEIFDFPPFFRAIDAHSLWHAATIPIIRIWYDWLIRDARECVFSGWFVGDALGRRLAPDSAVGKIGSRMLTPSAGVGEDGYAGITMLRAELRQLWSKSKTWTSDQLLSRAPNAPFELHGLTAKLNELAERAGFASGSANDAASASASGIGVGHEMTPGIKVEDVGVNQRFNAGLEGLTKRTEREEKGKEVSRE